MKKIAILFIFVGLVSAAAGAEWHNKEQKVVLNPSDDESGVKNTYYCVDQTDTCKPREDGQKYTGPFTVSKEGINYVRYNTKDKVGNIEETEKKIVKIDYTNPKTTDDYPGGWENTSTTVNLTCSDPKNPDASGCSSTLYCVDQTNSCTPGTQGKTIQFSSEGVYYLRYRSKDVAGNYESVHSTAVKLDFTDPDVLVNKRETDTDGTNASSSCTDSLSGCQDSSARIWASEAPAFQCPDNIAKYSKDSPFTVKEHLWICAAEKDKAGNWGDSGKPIEFSVGTLSITLKYPGKPDLVYTSLGSKIPFSITIGNEKENTRTINVSLENVEAQFENGKSYKVIELDGVEEKSLYGIAQPQNSGNHTLEIKMHDKTEGFTVTKEISIKVRKQGARTSSTGKQVPGIGLTHIAVMFVLAVSYYWIRIVR